MSFELDRIEELCNDRGWSHYRLAKEMDISPNSIGNLFRRTTVPSIPTIRHICQVFGIGEIFVRLRTPLLSKYQIVGWYVKTV